MKQQLFSSQLSSWLKGKGSKTLGDLDSVFAEKSIAIAIMLLMAVPALPLPTGGVTHIFEVITMLLALELIIGRRTIWLPKSWRKRSLGNLAEKKVLPGLLRTIRWFERFSRPRLSDFLQRPNSLRFIGLLTLIFTLFAFVAPPFSGLDTLPALGVVAMMLAVVLEDTVILVIGCLVGAVGTGMVIGLGTAVFEGFQRLL